MPFQFHSPFWQKARRWLRRFRITVLLTLLTLLAIFIYLNQHGVPGFVRRPLLDQLHSRGVDLEFTRLRLRWYRGLVADEVRIGMAQQDTATSFTAHEAQLQLSLNSLLRGHIFVKSIGIHDGQFDWTPGETNAPGQTLSVKNIEARLRLLKDDRCVVDNLDAQFAGAKFHATANLAHASALRDWPLLKQRQAPQPGTISARLKHFTETLEKISFAAPPEFRLRVDGDALDPQSFTAWLSLQAPEATTPWGRLTDAQLTAHLTAGSTNRLPHSDATLNLGHVTTPWAGLDNLKVEFHSDSLPGAPERVAAAMQASAEKIHSLFARATNLQFSAQWTNRLDEPIPLAGIGQLEMQGLNSFWAGARRLRISATQKRAAMNFALDPALGFWNELLPQELDWTADLADLQAGELSAKKIELGGDWRHAALALTRVSGEFDVGTFTGSARLDVPTRAVTFDLDSRFDVHKLSPLLTEKAAAWLAKYSWELPPQISGHGAVKLPAWTNQTANWRGEVLPTLQLDAQLAITNGAYLGAPADWAVSHVTYTNLVWTLPDLVAGRPEGLLKIYHVADDATHNYYFRIDSTINPLALRPMLNERQQRGLDYCEFNEPPRISGEVWGRWHDYERIGARARVAITNFAFRGQTGSSLTTELQYTNLVMQFFHPQLFRGMQTVTADAIVADFEAGRIYFTNGFSTAEPLVIARAIGPRTGHSLEPYEFKSPPTVRVTGYAPMWDMAESDLSFHVDGGPFAWWRFKLPHLTGDVRWRGDSLVLTNVSARFYDGTARGHAEFKLSEDEETKYSFFLEALDANLATLTTDLTARSNRLEGRLTGWLDITNAVSDDTQIWNGSTSLRLRDGLIWDVPVFGVLTQPLSALTPGIGLSRVSEARATGFITNSVAYTDDLEMRAPALRLQYRGTVDFAGRVNARVEAEPLRDAWLIGPVLNLALKPMTKAFEYKVTGTLSEPKTEPLHQLPKLMLMPLHPLQALEELFSPESGGTNAPSPVFRDVSPSP